MTTVKQAPDGYVYVCRSGHVSKVVHASERIQADGSVIEYKDTFVCSVRDCMAYHFPELQMERQTTRSTSATGT